MNRVLRDSSRRVFGSGVLLAAVCAGLSTGCTRSSDGPTFGEDLDFLKKHTDVQVIQSADGQAMAAVVPSMQGRLMTATPSGLKGPSTGWINHDLIASGEERKHIHAYGGAERFWLGPEGGQFSIYFPPGAPFEFEHWQTPAAIDTMAYGVVEQEPHRIVFQQDFSLINYAGTEFQVRVDREVRILEADEVEGVLGQAIDPSLAMVAVESVNTITNIGEQAWDRETGALSIWMLAMLNPSDDTVMVIPYREGPESELGPIVNDAYFGAVPPERLVARDGLIFYNGDGNERGKIGIGPARALPLSGSYAPSQGMVTLVHFDPPDPMVSDYVNSQWKIQEDPFAGDVVNAYNDGPPAPGVAQLGPFYELETSSPAAFLAPGESLTHTHRTMHFTGAPEALDALLQATLNVSAAELETVFAAE